MWIHPGESLPLARRILTRHRLAELVSFKTFYLFKNFLTFLAGKKRASRLFANLLGTLRTFDAKTKDENVAEKRAEIDKKVDEKIATDRIVGFLH